MYNQPSSPVHPVKILEYVENIAVLELPVPGFELLSLEEKLVAYHLWQAAAIGDSITWDQNYRHGLLLRNTFLGLLTFKKEIEALDPALFRKLETFTKKILVNHGNHDTWSTRKFIPTFTFEEFKHVYDIARQKRFPITLNDNFEDILCNPHFEEYLTQKNPEEGQDIVSASHNNFYQGVSLKDLDEFEDKNPNNSTFVKDVKSGRVIERVWRVGDEKVGIPPGLYAASLQKVSFHLGEAASHAPEQDRKHILLLKRYLEQGTASLWDEFNIEWLKANPTVDSILGFIEEYRDTRGRKGLFEGMVYFRDRKMTEMISTLASLSQQLELAAPWEQEYKKTWTQMPVANAITVIAGTGGAGPVCWAGVNLPNAQWIRDKYGSKNVIITNVTAASREAFARQSINEFIEKPEDKEMMLRTLPVRGPVMVALHEVVGHGSGKVSKYLKGDPHEHLQEYYSTLEEARAELCALHHIWNPLLRQKGIIPDEDHAKAAYAAYVLADLGQLRMLASESEIHEDHLRATHLIVQWLMHEKKCCEFYKGKDGKTYSRVIDHDKMRAGVSELLAEIQRIKATGDYEAIKTLVNEHGRQFDPALRDEIVMRSERIGYPSFYAYIMPEPKLVKNASGIVSDVILEYPAGLVEQAKRWKELEEQAQK